MEKELMVSIIKGINAKGWSPATSTNYSYRENENNVTFYISKSGIDKQNFTASDFMEVTLDGQPTETYLGIKPSAETLIHCYLYKNYPTTKCILHTHSLSSNILPVLIKKTKIPFSDYEIIKGIRGNSTHETTVHLPVFENSQNMEEFCTLLANRNNELINFGFLIFKHGIYTWGDSMAEAKRHLETWEFLLQAELTLIHNK
jgi:methylthioribulose-1-phosphate dehydratase